MTPNERPPDEQSLDELSPGELTDRLSDYALGLLEPTEAAEIETLLRRSEAARADLRSLNASLVTLTEALPPLEPPVRAWDALQARLESLPTVISAATPAVTPTATSAAPPTLQRPPSRPYLAWAVAACLALVAAGELVWVQRLQQQLQTASQQQARETTLVADFLGAPQIKKISLYGRQREGLGSVLARPGGDALFVLGKAPPPGQSYQAWGHSSNDWEPGSGEQLTSLEVSNSPVFAVVTQKFTALYLSLEPLGGSPQPTYPLSRVSLRDPAATTPLQVTSPADGAVVDRASVIVTGVVAADITDLSYTLNGEKKQTTTAGSRFSFTVSLKPGANTLSVQAAGPQGVTTKTLTLTRR